MFVPYSAVLTVDIEGDLCSEWRQAGSVGRLTPIDHPIVLPADRKQVLVQGLGVS
jgi:hypothetical protein